MIKIITYFVTACFWIKGQCQIFIVYIQVYPLWAVDWF